jgi:hypothetical protein
MASRLLATLSLAALLLAGCSDPSTAGGEDELPDLGLEATKTTGLIRGVVVDEAIRPLAGAKVTLRLADGQDLENTTGASGAFGFDGLPPGTYVLKARKLGYLEVQQSAEVVAGVDEPPAVKVLLQADAAGVPYAVTLVWEGFIQCGMDAIAACAIPDASTQIACSATSGGQPPVPPTVPLCLGNVTNEDFDEWFAIERQPTFLQAEMAWQSTQSVSQTFTMFVRASDRETYTSGFYEYSVDSDTGPSPLSVAVDADEIEDAELGNRTGLITAIFSGPAEGNPAGIGGFVVQQRFQVFVNVFFGYAPPEGWSFVETGSVPQPE